MRPPEPYAISDLDSASIFDRHYDLAIFASGHERRASYISSLVNKDQVSNVLVCGFDSYRSEKSRKSNDTHFESKWGFTPKIFSNRSDGEIYKCLDRISLEKEVNILVDYSSMTRFWYAAILNWLRFRPNESHVTVDFVYSQGIYSAEMPRLEIDDILCVPGCEGSAASNGETVALIGLGFDPHSVQCLLDDIEPDRVFSFVAGGSARSEYLGKVQSLNSDLISRFGEAIQLPMESVEVTLLRLSELIAPYNDGGSVSIIPLGPKPHVLASILLSIRFPRVTCLHVSGERQGAWDAEASGLIVGTRVTMLKAK